MARVWLFSITLTCVFTLPLFAAHLPGADYFGFEVERPAPKFLLTDIQGSDRRLQDLAGSYAYVMFGYLGCDRICHTQALMLQALARAPQLAQTGQAVNFVYIGMDPQRDSPQRVAEYFDALGANFLGLIARSEAHAQQVAGDFGAHYALRPGVGGAQRQIDHPGFVFLLDPQGNIRLVYSGANLAVPLMAEDFVRLVGADRPAIEPARDAA